MSDQQPYPPPGAPPPGAPPPDPQPYPPPGSGGPPPDRQQFPTPPSQWPAPTGRPAHQQPGQPPPYPSYQPPPGMLGAAHKPGAIPLRPLNLGDIYDGAFRIIRFNPKATVGAAVLVAVVVMAVPVLVTALLTFTVGLAFDVTEESSEIQGYGEVASFISLLGGMALLQVGMIFVTGMIAHVAAAAAVGRRLGLGEAWAATRGKRWRLLGLTLLLGLGLWLYVVACVVLFVPVALAVDTATAVVIGLAWFSACLAGACWGWVRFYYLAAPTLMLEPAGVFGAVGRAYRLTARQFWRTFGIALLTLILAGIAGQMFGFGLGMVGGIAMVAIPGGEMLALVLVYALTGVVTSAITIPFTGAVASLQYLDQRMRKEAYDVELMTQAGITAR